jgi:AmpE protein
MTLFILLLILAWERIFKMGDHWQLEHYLAPFFARVKIHSLWMSLVMTCVVVFVTWKLVEALSIVAFGVPTLLLCIMISLLCIGAGSLRHSYREYLRAVRTEDVEQQNIHFANLIAEQATLPDTAEITRDQRLHRIQNALIWVNFRYYLAPVFWFAVMGKLGPAILMGYGFLRAYQGWLARYGTPVQYAQSGVDALLHCLNWLPARLAGIAYALLGHGEKALPAWIASLSDLRTSQYKVVSQLAQFSLSKEPHQDLLSASLAAVKIAKKATFTIVIIVALLTIYGTLA